MVNENVMTFEQNIEREQYLHFCKMNGFKPNKIETLIIWGKLMRGMRHASSL